MIQLKTFGEIKNSRAIQVAAACKDSVEFRQLVNEATDVLMQRGDWPGTLVPMRVMVRKGCIVWPRQVQRVRRMNHCISPVKVESIWGDYINNQDYINWSGSMFYSWGGPQLSNRGIGCGGRRETLVNQGRVATFNDIPSDLPRYIRCYCLCHADIGKTVTIFGADANNLPLQTKNPDGTYSEGIVLTLSAPFASSSTYVSRIDRIIKDETQKSVPTYCYEAVSNTLLQLGDYAPDEINPSYSKDRISVFTNCNNDATTVLALVKLAFIPVYNDNDFVLIPSVSALKLAIKAIKYSEAGDVESYVNFMLMAVRELNMVLDNEYPVDQIPVDTGFGGGTMVGSQQVI